jgi:predicted aspartyl protease
MNFLMAIGRTAALTSIALSLSAASAAGVPLSIAPTGHATVPVSGSFGVRQFVLDTGAEGSAIYADFANETGLRVTGSMPLQGQTGSSDVPLIQLGALTLDKVRTGPIQAVKLPPRADGVKLAGIIGLDVFGDRTLDFDVPSKRVALLPPGRRLSLSSAPITASRTAGNLLTVPVRIGLVSATAVIDTGARKTRINWALGRLIGLQPENLEAGDTIHGATNASIATGSTRIANVQIGSRTLRNAPVLVADLPVFEVFGVAKQPAVILGLDWLTQTRLVIDFPANLVWFEAPERR